MADDTVKALDLLADGCDVAYKDFKFASGTKHNGWEVPKKWEVVEAKIFRGQREVYDGKRSPLGVITNSEPFDGVVEKAELLEHLHFSPKRPNAVPYHFRLQYRPWEKDWGFCVPRSWIDSLQMGKYRVRLKTRLSKGKMITREFTIPGRSKETIVFAAHIDHPGQANDDVAGCGVGIALINEIKKNYDKPKWTYKLVLTQEIVGSVFYLKALAAQAKKIKYGLFLEMLGNDKTLLLQKSFGGETYIDKVCELALSGYVGARKCAFREGPGNDEIVFEAPGYEIPMPSLSRWPYGEYHTSDDNLGIIDERQLQEALEYVMKVVSVLESDGVVKRRFKGLVSLANPEYDMYVDPGQIISGGLDQNRKLALFQYKMPRYLDGKWRMSEIAGEFGLDYWWMRDYFAKMEKKGLVKISRSVGRL